MDYIDNKIEVKIIESTQYRDRYVKIIHRAFVSGTKAIQSATRALKGINDIESGDSFTLEKCQHREEVDNGLRVLTA